LDTVDICKQLERVKWFLWHGNVVRALETIEDIEDEPDLIPQEGISQTDACFGEGIRGLRDEAGSRLDSD